MERDGERWREVERDGERYCRKKQKEKRKKWKREMEVEINYSGRYTSPQRGCHLGQRGWRQWHIVEILLLSFHQHQSPHRPPARPRHAYMDSQRTWLQPAQSFTLKDNVIYLSLPSSVLWHPFSNEQPFVWDAARTVLGERTRAGFYGNTHRSLAGAALWIPESFGREPSTLSPLSPHKFTTGLSLRVVLWAAAAGGVGKETSTGAFESSSVPGPHPIQSLNTRRTWVQ